MEESSVTISQALYILSLPGALAAHTARRAQAGAAVGCSSLKVWLSAMASARQCGHVVVSVKDLRN